MTVAKGTLDAIFVAAEFFEVMFAEIAGLIGRCESEPVGETFRPSPFPIATVAPPGGVNSTTELETSSLAPPPASNPI